MPYDFRQLVPYPQNNTEKLDAVLNYLSKKGFLRNLKDIIYDLNWKLDQTETFKLRMLIENSECTSKERLGSDAVAYKITDQAKFNILEYGSYSAWVAKVNKEKELQEDAERKRRLEERGDIYQTFGANSPIAGRDLSMGNAISDSNINKESEATKELNKQQLADLPVEKWYRKRNLILAVLAIVVTVALYLLTREDKM